MTSTAREQWRSARGFLLASLGAAVGLGNVWRFSYVAGENGGGAFLLVYLLMVLLVALPLLLAEYAIGRATQRESAAALHVLAPGSPWRHLGLLGVLVSALVLGYYAVIAGWVFKYLGLYLQGDGPALAERGFAQAFDAHLASGVEPLLWQLVGLVLCGAVVVLGVRRGIERVSGWLMPLMAALLVLLVLRNTALPGFGPALEFLFMPDWTVLARPQVYLAALGQALFSIGVAMGVMVTYGSYLGPQQPLPHIALAVVLGDTLFALTAGLVIFPAVFSAGLDPAQGPGLAFVVLPQVFARLEGGAVYAAVFFLLLSIAALTSMVSLLEVPVAYAMERWGCSRLRASVLLGAALFLLGVPASLGHGPWAPWQLDSGPGVLALMDFVAVDLLLPINALLLSLMVGWVWSARSAQAAAGLVSAGWTRLWRGLLRYGVPLLVGLVLLGGLSQGT